MWNRNSSQKDEKFRKIKTQTKGSDVSSETTGNQMVNNHPWWKWLTGLNGIWIQMLSCRYCSCNEQWWMDTCSARDICARHLSWCPVYLLTTTQKKNVNKNIYTKQKKTVSMETVEFYHNKISVTAHHFSLTEKT